MKPLILIVALVAPKTCLAVASLLAQGIHDVSMKTDTLVDQTRNRQIPVAIYTDVVQRTGTLRPAIISHGYGGRNTYYAFIATYLASHGYYVASIQQEIPGAEPLPRVGNPYETRKPSWERGVQNITFVIGELKRPFPSWTTANCS